MFADAFVFGVLSNFVKQLMVLSNGLRCITEALGDNFEDSAFEGSRNFLVELANSKTWDCLDLT